MIKQVNDGLLRVRELRITLERTDGEIITVGTLTGGPGQVDKGAAHPMLVENDRWRDYVFDALFSWMNHVLEAADDEEE